MTETTQPCPICGRTDCFSSEPKTTSCCWSHYEIEPLGLDPYRVCFECGHVYQSPADLVAAYNAVVSDKIENPPPIPPGVDWEWSPPRPKTIDDAPEIFFCQECLHDF